MLNFLKTNDKLKVDQICPTSQEPGMVLGVRRGTGYRSRCHRAHCRRESPSVGGRGHTCFSDSMKRRCQVQRGKPASLSGAVLEGCTEQVTAELSFKDDDGICWKSGKGTPKEEAVSSE